MAIGQQRYWNGSRVGRRSVLRGTAVGVAGLAGAALIGCSSSGNAPSPAAPAGPAGATGAAAGQPRRGGILRQPTRDDADTFDQLVGQSAKVPVTQGFAYSRLMKNEAGDGSPAPGIVSGDLVEKWEQPDPLTFIFHLRQNVVWDRRAPTNGRKFVADDVLKSWEKYSSKSNYRTALSNAASKDAPIKTLEAIDGKTLKATLAFQDAIVLSALSAERNLWIHPMESMNGGFDPAKEMRGTGPFFLEEYKPSVSYRYVRNPDWYGGPARPYLDAIEEPIIPVDAQLEAQFRSGNIHWGGRPNLPIPNIPAIFKEVKDTHIVTGAPSATGSGLDFGGQPGQPWKDARLRRALSMSLDRDTLIDVLFEPKALEAVGVKVKRYWNNTINAGFGKFWVDPKGKDAGPGGQYYKYNIEEATKLMAAAGFSPQKPLKVELIHTPQYRNENHALTLQSTAKKSGFDIVLWASDYTTDWVPRILRGKTNWAASTPGMAVVAIHGFSAQDEPGLHLQAWYQSSGSMNVVGVPSQYPVLEEMIQKQRSTFNVEDRVKQIHDIQRYIMDNMVAMGIGPAIDHVNISFKKLHGPERWQAWPGGLTASGGGTEILTNYWLDA